MFFFLRVEIRESVDEAGESRAELDAAVEAIRSSMRGLGWGNLGSDRNQIADIRYMNGFPVAIVHGASNHDRGTSQGLVDLLSVIGDCAPGSYGFAWYLDTEQKDSWIVHTLIRGEVEKREDPWFSPIIPTVEDADPLTRS